MTQAPLSLPTSDRWVANDGSSDVARHGLAAVYTSAATCLTGPKATVYPPQRGLLRLCRMGSGRPCGTRLRALPPVAREFVYPAEAEPRQCVTVLWFFPQTLPGLDVARR